MGAIFFENIDLKHTDPNSGIPLFKIGGNIQSLTFRNIRHNDPNIARTLFEIGRPFWNTTPDSIDDYLYKDGLPPVTMGCWGMDDLAGATGNAL